MGFALSMLITFFNVQAQTPANFTPARYQDTGRDKRIESTFSVVEQMIKKVKKIMNEKEDTLRIYVLCSPCREKVRCVGMGRVTEAPGVVIV